MKKTIIVLAVLAPLAISCNKSLGIKTGQLDKITVSFSQPADEDGSKTTLVGSKNLGWNNGDVLFVSTPTKIGTAALATTYAEYTTSAADGTQTATFVYSGGDPVSADTHYAVMYSAPVSDTKGYNSAKPTASTSSDYIGKAFSNTPSSYLVAFVPCEQTYVLDGLAPYTMPMYGYCTDLSGITLTCLGSILRFNLYSTSGSRTVKSIKLRGYNSSSSAAGAIAGAYGIERTPKAEYKGTVDPNNYTGTWALSSSRNLGADTIVYNCNDAAVSSDSANPTQFNVVFAKGISNPLGKISISVELTSGEKYETSLTKTFANNKVYSLQTKDIDSF